MNSSNVVFAKAAQSSEADVLGLREKFYELRNAFVTFLQRLRKERSVACGRSVFPFNEYAGG